MILLLLVVVLLIWALGSLPVYPYSRNWGYTPISIPVILLIILILLFFGGAVRMPRW